MIRTLRIALLLPGLVAAIGGPAAQAAPAAMAAIPAYAAGACHGADGYAAAFGGRRTFLWAPERLEAVKAKLERDPATAAAWRTIQAEADAALAGPVYSVTDKRRVPPSGDKHDYMSLAPYWWPDPTNAGGAYVRHDGKVNPERDTEAFDTERMSRMSSVVEALALAYYFTGQERYAARAVTLLEVWFLDPPTRMNPNANFAQGVPGRAPGRAEGVLDTFRLLPVVESIGLLGPSKSLTPDDVRGLELWFARYVDWMATSPNGSAENAATNNHGAWFDAQIAAYALFARRPEIARSVVAAAPTRRIAAQIEPDGRLPLELKRTRALHYSVFALQAMADLADLGRCLGHDLWRFRTTDGRGLMPAVDFVASYVGREASFPYPELKPGATEETLALLAQASAAYADAALGDKAASLQPANAASHAILVSPPYRAP